MYYRTRVYLAGDWDGDSDMIQQIKTWKENGFFTLDFTDAHDLMQARDSSLHCTVKKSLSERMNASKKFVLIVGEHTNTVTKGGCQDCTSYSSFYKRCSRGGMVDYRSFVKYECDKAARDYRNGEMQIVVIYNSLRVNTEKCPEAVRSIGKHVAGRKIDAYGYSKPNYQIIKDAIMN